MSASEQELFAKKIRKEVKNESKQKSPAKRRAKIKQVAL